MNGCLVRDPNNVLRFPRTTAPVLAGSRVLDNWSSTGYDNSDSELLYDLRFTDSQFILAPSPFRLMTSIFFNSTEHMRSYSLCNILPDERMGLSCIIAAGPRQRSHSQVQVPRDSWPHFTVSNSRIPNLQGQVPIFISPRNGLAQLYPRHWVPFLSPFTACRATVEVIQTLLHTLECQSAMPWCINLRQTEYKTLHSRLLKKLLYVYSTEVNRFTKCTFLFPSYRCSWCYFTDDNPTKFSVVNRFANVALVNQKNFFKYFSHA
jgi:hypothetical protein